MSTDTAEREDVQEFDSSEPTDYTQYRALSAMAVASLIVGLLSLLAFLNIWFTAIPIVGAILAVTAIRKIRNAPDDLTGLGIARIGLLLSLLFGITGPSYLGYVYATEVPDGFDRISYADLQPNESTPGEVVPKSALSLNGKKVFIKGYVYPGKQTHNIKQFLLCRDQGDCCFGGDPKITDRIEVTLAEPLRLTYSQKMFRLAGTFRVAPGQSAEGVGAVLYHLEADHLQ